MKKLILFLCLGLLFSAETAFASVGYNFSGASHSSYNGDFCPAGTYDGADYFTNGSVYLNSFDTNRWGVYDGGFADNGNWVYIGIVSDTSLESPNTVGTWYVSPYPTTDSLVVTQIITCGVTPPTPPPEGVAGIIATASTTIFGDLGFGLGDISDLMKAQLLLIMGSGLGFFRLMFPFIVAVACIASIVYFLYRAFRFFRH